MKKQKGITLVALIITIIILLILAGISIQALTNQGLFAQAEETKKRTENAQKYEDEMLKNYLEQMNDIIDEKKNTYMIIYNLNEGEGTIENQTKIEGENINLTTLVPKRENYTFLGWSTNKEATEPEYLVGATYSKDENIELFAIWEKTKLYLYKDGDQCTEVTGGWGNTWKFTYRNGNPNTQYSPIFDEDSFTISVLGASSYTVCSANTNNKISLADYSTINIEYENVVAGWINFGGHPDLTFDGTQSSEDKFAFRVEMNSENTGSFITTADISSTTEEVYIEVGINIGWASDAHGKTKVKRIWLEK